MQQDREPITAVASMIDASSRKQLQLANDQSLAVRFLRHIWELPVSRRGITTERIWNLFSSRWALFDVYGGVREQW